MQIPGGADGVRRARGVRRDRGVRQARGVRRDRSVQRLPEAGAGLAQGPAAPAARPWRSGGRSAAPRRAWLSPRPPEPRGRCPRARARPSRCRCPRCPRPASGRGPAGRARSGCGRAPGGPGGLRCSTASSRMCRTCARWRGGCSASSATSTRESCRRSGRSAPSSSWSTCGRCRRSWHGSTLASTCAWRSSPRSRRRRRPTGTWTSCWRTWKSSAAPYRSCTWPRARTPRTLRPDPARAPGPDPCPTPAPPNRARPRPPRHGGACRGPMTSSGGAGAMAAALGPRDGDRDRDRDRDEAEGWRRLLRAVTRLQARARGFLLRRQLRAAREEFEAVVLQIEGHLSHLRWTGAVLPRPRFLPEDCAGAAPGAQPGSLPAGEAEPQGDARAAQPRPGKPLDPVEAPESIPKKTPEEPERPGGCVTIPPPAPNPPNLGSGADQNPEKGRQEWDNESITSEWDSTDPGAQPEIPQELQGLPRAELQSYRRHLLMELLWIQQAIGSRKNFLMLKQKLGIPEHPGSVPELLGWCGEALEMQQQS